MSGQICKCRKKKYQPNLYKMKNVIRTLAFITVFFTTVSCTKQEITCVISGEVFGIDYDTLALMKATEDFDHGEKIYIPVKDGKFEHELIVGVQEVYVLFFEQQLIETGGLFPYFFIPEDGLIEFRIHPFEEREKNEVLGGAASKEPLIFLNLQNEIFTPLYEPLYEKINALIENNEYFSEEYLMLQESYQKAVEVKDYETAVYYTYKRVELSEAGKHLSPLGEKIQNKLDSINEEGTRWRQEYYAESLSIYSYFMLLTEIKSSEYNKSLNIEDLKDLARKFYKKFPNHPYTELTKNLLKAKDLIQVGNTYLDFSLPDLEGNIHKLSDIIDGKYAVIDLWASWCGPCIMGSRELMPVYEEFKDKGFTICGVAREFKNTDRMVKRIENEKYPWINLIELDDENQIWLKYGTQGGGKKFLVDNEGVILAIEPKADEVRAILNERLND